MKLHLTREFFIPKDSTEIKAPDCSAVAYLFMTAGGGKVCAKAFSGKRAKPDWFYSFRDEAQARARIAIHADAVRLRETNRNERAAKIQAEKCRTPLDVWNKVQRGENYISAAETAICLRAALQRHFPEVKFSVTSENYSMGCSVQVAWTDGPRWKTVQDIASRYSFAGFDGMIDMEFSKRRWLSRDGEMTLAHSEGTTGSAGIASESIGDPHGADCVLVKSGADYVTTNRHRSFAAELALARAVAEKYGVAMPGEFSSQVELGRWTSSQRVEFNSGAGEWFSTLMHRTENDVAS